MNLFTLFSLLLLTLFTLCLSADSNRPELEERTPYPVPLLKLSVIDNNTGVRISREGSEDYVIISPLSDFSVKNSRSAVNKTTYRELNDKAYQLTNFEAEQLLQVTRSFIETLEEFEKNLRNEKWGQCRYLDAFLPKFVRGYYILMGAAHNNVDKYSRDLSVFESKYDVSLNSPLTDTRINSWKETAECTVKLRISIKELIYQLKLWEKRELSNRNRNPDISLRQKSEEALGLFVRIYFSIKAPVFCSQR